MKQVSVFKFHGHFADDVTDFTDRYIVAESTEAAREIFEEYNNKLEQDGYVKVVACGEPTVEIDYALA